MPTDEIPRFWLCTRPDMPERIFVLVLFKDVILLEVKQWPNEDALHYYLAGLSRNDILFDQDIKYNCSIELAFMGRTNKEAIGAPVTDEQKENIIRRAMPRALRFYTRMVLKQS
jgi:hypothetical protein